MGNTASSHSPQMLALNTLNSFIEEIKAEASEGLFQNTKGNTASSPSPQMLALNTLNTFIEEIRAEASEGLFQNTKEYTDHLFGILLEDFIITNKDLAALTVRDQIKCIGTILLTHYMFSLEVSGLVKKEHGRMIIRSFAEGRNPLDIITEYLSSVVRYDGTNLYGWEGDKWVQSDVFNLSEAFGCRFVVTTLGITQGIAPLACETVNEYLSKFNEAIRTFNSSTAHTHFFKAIKKNAFSFNMRENAIPCYSSVFLASKGKARAHKPKDEFTVRLPFDISRNISDIVDEYFSNICGPGRKTDAADVADFIVSCGCRLSDSITVITGPPESGKKTLLNLVRTMYGPYACSGPDHDGGDVDYNLVRTCFYENDDLLFDENLVSNHPCQHIVLISEAHDLPKTYGYRSVRKLNLSQSIRPWKQERYIISRLSTRKHFASVLGWAAKKYNTVRFSTAEDSLYRRFLQFMASKADMPGGNNSDSNGGDNSDSNGGNESNDNGGNNSDGEDSDGSGDDSDGSGDDSEENSLSRMLLRHIVSELNNVEGAGFDEGSLSQILLRLIASELNEPEDVDSD